jgi:uncharacterized protein
MDSRGRTGGKRSPDMSPGAARGQREEKRSRFSGDGGSGGVQTGQLRATPVVAVLGVLLAVFVVVMLSHPEAATAQVIQQVPAATAAVASGQVTVSAEEVRTKKIVYWDYSRADGTSVPLMAYQCPCGVLKMAVRMCEPCDGYSFRIEGTQLACNSCDTRWDLETLRGISGGCQDYPPDLLRTRVIDGRLTVDEARVARWTPRLY